MSQPDLEELLRRSQDRLRAKLPRKRRLSRDLAAAALLLFLLAVYLAYAL